jgi:proton-dependent oligopeptide transporter, POT family
MKLKKNHPSSLKIFFSTEMWERYGFYVLQTLMALYLSTYYNWDDDKTYSLVGSFTAITYVSPIVGGYIADKHIGQKKAIIYGAAILLFNYVILTVFRNTQSTLFSLAGIAVGTGLLKPNISSLLGNQYPQGSRYKDSGFTIFYMGITAGIILGTTLPSIIRDDFGWAACFFSAACGLLLAIVIFTIGIKKYQITDFLHSSETKSNKIYPTFILLTILWTLSFLTLQSKQIALVIFVAVAVYSSYYIFSTAKKEPHSQRKKTHAIFYLCIISVLFWSFYFQMFLSLTLFITRTVAPSIATLSFPAPYYVGIQSFGIIVFGFIFSKVWAILKPRVIINSLVNKFCTGMVLIFTAYVIVVYAIKTSPTGEYVSPILIMSAYLLISMAELLISPVGLSAITTLASRQKVSTMTGIFFVSLGLGGHISGYLAQIASVNDLSQGLSSYKQTYLESFIILTSLLFLCVIASFLLSAWVKASCKKNN